MLLQERSRSATQPTQMQMLRDLYGVAIPAKLSIETQILARHKRLPGGLPSSMLGLESLSGSLDQFDFTSYLGLPQDSEVAPVDVHSVMEARLGLAPTTKPLTRPLL